MNIAHIAGKNTNRMMKNVHLQQLLQIFLFCSTKMRNIINPKNKPLTRQMLEEITRKKSKMKGNIMIPRRILKKQQKTKASPYLWGILLKQIWLISQVSPHSKQNSWPHLHFRWLQPFYFSRYFWQFRHFLILAGSSISIESQSHALPLQLRHFIFESLI